jgi:uncharacterized membrane protein YgcG
VLLIAHLSSCGDPSPRRIARSAASQRLPDDDLARDLRVPPPLLDEPLLLFEELLLRVEPPLFDVPLLLFEELLLLVEPPDFAFDEPFELPRLRLPDDCRLDPPRLRDCWRLGFSSSGSGSSSGSASASGSSYSSGSSCSASASGSS